MLVPVSKHTILFSLFFSSLPLSLFAQRESPFSAVADDLQDIQKSEDPRRATSHIVPRHSLVFLLGHGNQHHKYNSMLVAPAFSKYLSIWNLSPTPMCNSNPCTRMTFSKKKGGGGERKRVKKRAERHPCYKTLSTCRGVGFLFPFFPPSRKIKLKLSVSGVRAARLFTPKT